MINVLLLCFSVCLATSKNLLSKLCPKGKTHSFNALAFLSAFALAFVFSVASGIELSLYVLFFAVLYALFTLLAQVTYIKAVAIGDFALSSLMYSCGFVIPAVLGAIIYDEGIKITQIAGLILLIVSFAVGKLSKENGKSERLWMLFSLTAMLSSGAVGLVQKIFRSSEYGAKLDSLLVFAFLIMFASSLCFALLTHSKNTLGQEPSGNSNAPVNANRSKNVIIFMSVSVCMGIVIFAQNKTNLYLSGAMDSMIFFPVVNGGTVIMSALSDRFILKQKTELKKILSVILGIVSIILIVI